MIPDPNTVSRIIRQIAEEVVIPRFRHLASHEISEKNPGDIVTIADEEAEQALARELSALLPGAAIVGEEGASRDPDSMHVLSGEQPVWVIDPVDGTQNFADGKERFAMIVALVRGGRTVAGWIHEPIKNTTVWAIEGEGAFEGAQRLVPIAPVAQVSQVGSLSRKMAQRLETLRERSDVGDQVPKTIVRYRCVGAEYAELARGNLHFARYGGRLKPWDHAAGILIHQEIGGYNAVIETLDPYRPGPTQSQSTVLLAPDRESWRYLVDILDG